MSSFTGNNKLGVIGVVLGICVVIIALFAYSQISILQKNASTLETDKMNLQNQVANLENQVATLNADKVSLENKVADLQRQVVLLQNYIMSQNIPKQSRRYTIIPS